MLAQLQGGFWVPYDWSPDDRKALVYEYISANENNLWIIDVTTGRKTLLTPRRETNRLPTGLVNSARMAKASMSQPTAILNISGLLTLILRPGNTNP